MALPQAQTGILDIKPYKAGKSSNISTTEPIKLSSNENPYGCSPKAAEAYAAAASDMNRYPNAGCSGVREAISEVYDIPEDNIICGAGSDELLGMLVQAFAGEGDEVLYPEHGFLMYKIYALGNGAVPVEAKETNLKTDIDALLAAVTERTKIVFLANPNNPTGSYISGAELKRLRDGLPEHVVLAVDAAYAEYVEEDDYSHGIALALSTQNTVMLRTFSKIYGLPAVRLGWAVGSDYLMDILGRIRSPFNVTSAAQAAGAAAVRDVKWMENQRAINNKALAALTSKFQALGLGVYPSVGNFILVEFGGIERANDVLKGLAAQEIYVRDVMAYKLPSCLRISIGTEEENAKLLEALKEIL